MAKILSSIPVHTLCSGMYNATTRTFVEEASALGNVHGRLYDDACDVGFGLYSPKTGRTMTFFLADTEYCGAGEDREIAAWVYEPTLECLREMPEAAGVKFHVLND